MIDGLLISSAPESLLDSRGNLLCKVVEMIQMMTILRLK